MGIHVLYELFKNTSAKILCFIRSNKQASTFNVRGDYVGQKLPTDKKFTESDFYIG
ncbi:MAG: hypothetical protein IJK81_09415 [Selenomonadaceae bacterium]|nr:hypothetical protein [Selenomonadaceae bacterium]